MIPAVRRKIRVLLAVFAALALGVTLWTWFVFEGIPLEVSAGGSHWYTECDPPTTFGRLLINVILLASVSGATFLAAIVFQGLQRAGRLRLRYHSQR